MPALVAEIDRRLAALPQPVTRPPPTAPQMPPPVEHPTVVESHPAGASTAVTATQPEKKSFVRRNWWIFPVGAVVLAGAAVGIYFAVRPSSGVDCGSASLGCVPANQ